MHGVQVQTQTPVHCAHLVVGSRLGRGVGHVDCVRVGGGHARVARLPRVRVAVTVVALLLERLDALYGTTHEFAY